MFSDHNRIKSQKSVTEIYLENPQILENKPTSKYPMAQRGSLKEN